MLQVGPIVPDCLINISASPYYHGKLRERQRVFGQLCRHNNLPLLYANQVGGQDGLIFDGHSMVIDLCRNPPGGSRRFRRRYADR